MAWISYSSSIYLPLFLVLVFAISVTCNLDSYLCWGWNINNTSCWNSTLILYICFHGLVMLIMACILYDHTSSVLGYHSLWQGNMIHLIYLFGCSLISVYFGTNDDGLVWSFSCHTSKLFPLLILSVTSILVTLSFLFFLNLCQAHMWLTRQTTSSTSIWTRKQSCYSNLGEEEWWWKQQWVRRFNRISLPW